MKARALRIGGVAVTLAAAGVAIGLFLPAGEAEARPRVTMHKSPFCQCCDGWAKHMEAAGFRVSTVATDRIGEVKGENGVPGRLSSCHTALVEGHVVEGHVPAEAVRRMLAEGEPYGIAAPGMPSGSPGMSGLPEPYDVVAFEPGRPGAVFATY